MTAEQHNTEKKNKNFHKTSVNGKIIPVRLSSVLCDAPAKALVKSIKTYTGYCGCYRCELKGEYIDGAVRIIDTESLVYRTDQTFRLKSNPQHHTGTSPFINVPSFDMIKNFPNDYMHSVLLGIVRKLIAIWTTTKGPKIGKLSQVAINRIDAKLQILKERTPNEFGRKPRSLRRLDRFKATELRLFLLYTGKIALKGILPSNLYDNFMDLSVAISILLSEKLTAKLCDKAGELLHRFVIKSSSNDLYGRGFMVYNVHSLLHITEDAKNYRSLNNCSCFPFENYLSSVKRLVRSGKAPLQQIARRLQEKDICLKQEHQKKPIVHWFTQTTFISTQKQKSAIRSYVECEETELPAKCTAHRKTIL
jgi:hypothetical protein